MLFDTNTLITVTYIILAFIAVIYITRQPLQQQLAKLGHDTAAAEIADIEAESAAEINRKLGGLDTINADNLLTGIRNNRIQPLVFQTRDLGRLPAKTSVVSENTSLGNNSVWAGYSNNHSSDSNNNIIEGFEATTGINSTPVPKLQLYYRMSCGYTQAFLPVWYEVVAALPTASIRYEEVNCEDASGNCEAAQIDGVPTLRIIKYNPDGSEASIEEYNGQRTFNDIKNWLSGHGIALIPQLKVNVADESEVITDMGGAPEVTARAMSNNKEEFVGMQILDATGNLKSKHDNAYLDAAALDEHGHYHDVTDGVYDATFSKCQSNSQNPGYQIFTHRGQWGCVRPEPGTGIATPFDAAFTVASQYLNTLPPRQISAHGGLHPDTDGDPSNGEESKVERQQRMNNAARKYAGQLRKFGLCDLEKLNEKYIIPDEIRRGRLLPPMENMTADDYEPASMAAMAIYTACGSPSST